MVDATEYNDLVECVHIGFSFERKFSSKERVCAGMTNG